MDINEVQTKLNELEVQRQESLKEIEQLQQAINNIKYTPSDDVFENVEEQKRVVKEMKKIQRKLDKKKIVYDAIFDNQTNLAKERTELIERCFDINKEIASKNATIENLNKDQQKLNGLILATNKAGGNDAIVEAIRSQIAEKENEKNNIIKEIENLDYEKSIIFDSSKRKEEAKEEVKEETKDKEQDNANQDIANKLNAPVTDINGKEFTPKPDITPYEFVPEEENEKDNTNIKDGIDAIEKGNVDTNGVPEKKKVTFIKHITDYCKNHPKVIVGAVAAITATAALVLGAGAIPALLAGAGDVAAAYIGYKATKGR